MINKKFLPQLKDNVRAIPVVYSIFLPLSTHISALFLQYSSFDQSLRFPFDFIKHDQVNVLEFQK